MLRKVIHLGEDKGKMDLITQKLKERNRDQENNFVFESKLNQTRVQQTYNLFDKSGKE